MSDMDFPNLMPTNRKNRKALPGARKRDAAAQEQSRKAGALGGRPKGVKDAPREARADIRDMARKYGPEALDQLISIAKSNSTPPAARVTAIKELLDRGYGRPAQPIIGEDGAPPVAVSVIELVAGKL